MPAEFDVGINTGASENLAVVTEVVRNGKREIVPLDLPRRYSATGSDRGAFRNALNRMVLHLSIGQPY